MCIQIDQASYRIASHETGAAAMERVPSDESGVQSYETDCSKEQEAQ